MTRLLLSNKKSLIFVFFLVIIEQCSRHWCNGVCYDSFPIVVVLCELYDECCVGVAGPVNGTCCHHECSSTMLFSVSDIQLHRAGLVIARHEIAQVTKAQLILYKHAKPIDACS